MDAWVGLDEEKNTSNDQIHAGNVDEGTLANVEELDTPELDSKEEEGNQSDCEKENTRSKKASKGSEKQAEEVVDFPNTKNKSSGKRGSKADAGKPKKTRRRKE